MMMIVMFKASHTFVIRTMMTEMVKGMKMMMMNTTMNMYDDIDNDDDEMMNIKVLSHPLVHFLTASGLHPDLKISLEEKKKQDLNEKILRYIYS